MSSLCYVLLRRPTVVLGCLKNGWLSSWPQGVRLRVVTSPQMPPTARKGMVGLREKSVGQILGGSVHVLCIQTADQIEYLYHYKTKRKKTYINQDKQLLNI